jgi:hypothetical protein
MIVPIETVEIDVIEGPGRVAECLGRLARLEAPGFVLHPDGVQPGAELVDEIKQTIQANGGAVDRRYTFSSGSLGWHFDHRPRNDGIMGVTIHHTTKGIAAAQLIVPRPAWWPQAPSYSVLPPNFLERIETGEVDDELVVPRIYETHLNPDDVLVFAEGGPQPAIHNFTNIEEPRFSRAYAGLMVRSRHAG